MKDLLKGFLFLLILVVFLLIITSLQDDSNSVKIYKKVHSINGEILDIKVKSMFTDTPFTLNTKEMRIYRFTYMLDGDKKVGWFRDTIFGDNWILDYQKD